ncbi:MAG: 50S ribosomal protein L11 [Candidatus Nealsonbacteria bacterium CG23_combo_of_CG06-09_8_20_14_all_39_17]|uniref:Large ribosomal subunit protein uL11 n=1 Tax=Candidatus Nealsonbacteria bacterium CG23_combo_of_CG06-09_8_20_14_all_39_17 TaxID=1974722 RepID=A0A2G9YV48_9BACT|nr:MAG: 50S ribosomal protein L11 [Candidatus Nealsonbacteria bacterium CG23_combo_of_CG06-09_8_20_14_all_39_17]PIU44114.1 MAG: 50S ribosomal protein L11 [Candidatus Nealsonbacteria bacterium CG07_land_8_20_14_0_80_39_13]
MAKAIKAIIKLQIPAGSATPAPPVGPALAQHGVNIGEFIQKFNEATKASSGFKIPVEITVFTDRTYSFILKQPPASQLIKKEIGIEKGSGAPNKKKVAKMTKEQVRKVALQKMPDLNTDNIEQAMKTIEGTAKNMGIEIQ